MMKRFGFYAVFFLFSQNAFCQYFGGSQATDPSDQFFEQQEDESDTIEEESLSEMIFGKKEDAFEQGTVFFSYDEIREIEEEEPEMGEDAGGQPGDPSPIDGWLIALPIAAVFIAVKYLRKKPQAEV